MKKNCLGYALLDTKHGKMLVNTHDSYCGRSFIHYGEFLADETALFESLVPDGGVFIECGANIGTHTVPLSLRSRTVFAFEPQRLLFQMLCANVALNGVTNVIALQQGVGADHGQVRIQVPDPRQFYNFTGLDLIRDAVDDGEPVAIVPLDYFSMDRVDLIKIDVEGMELDVLMGAADMIATHQPTLYIEAEDVQLSKQLIEYLWSINYECCWVLINLFNPYNFYRNPEDNLFPGETSCNLLAFPKDRVDSLPGRKITDSGLFPKQVVSE